MPAEAVAAGLATDPAAGLTAGEAASRLQRAAPTSWSNGAASRRLLGQAGIELAPVSQACC
jgi:hypothetical protein